MVSTYCHTSAQLDRYLDGIAEQSQVEDRADAAYEEGVEDGRRGHYAPPAAVAGDYDEHVTPPSVLAAYEDGFRAGQLETATGLGPDDEVPPADDERDDWEPIRWPVTGNLREAA